MRVIRCYAPRLRTISEKIAELIEGYICFGISRKTTPLLKSVFEVLGLRASSFARTSIRTSKNSQIENSLTTQHSRIITVVCQGSPSVWLDKGPRCHFGVSTNGPEKSSNPVPGPRQDRVGDPVAASVSGCNARKD